MRTDQRVGDTNNTSLTQEPIGNHFKCTSRQNNFPNERQKVSGMEREQHVKNIVGTRCTRRIPE